MLAPDWVCEAISPHNERHDRVRKMPVYAREGVRHAWLVDPLERSLEVLRLEAGRWILLSTHRGDDITVTFNDGTFILDRSTLVGNTLLAWGGTASVPAGQNYNFQLTRPEESMQLYERGIRRRLAPMLNGDRRLIELAYSLLFTLPGTPALIGFIDAR